MNDINNSSLCLSIILDLLLIAYLVKRLGYFYKLIRAVVKDEQHKKGKARASSLLTMAELVHAVSSGQADTIRSELGLDLEDISR